MLHSCRTSYLLELSKFSKVHLHCFFYFLLVIKADTVALKTEFIAIINQLRFLILGHYFLYYFLLPFLHFFISIGFMFLECW